MPRYFFHRTDGGFDVDHEGTELKDLQDARVQAILYAAGTMKDRPDYVWDGGDLRVEVADESGILLMTVIVMVVDAVTPDAIAAALKP